MDKELVKPLGNDTSKADIVTAAKDDVSEPKPQKKATNEAPTKYKAMPAILLSSGDEGEFEAVVAVMGIVDDGKDRDLIYNGAFENTIIKSGPNGRGRIKPLWQHDFKDPIGIFTEIKELQKHELPQSVLDIAPTATGGLYVKGKLALVQNGLQAYELLKLGANALEWSIGWREKKATRDEKGINHIYEIELVEVSAVTMGMNPATQTLSIKQLEHDCPNCAKTKAVVPYQRLKLLDENVAWDAADAELKVRAWAGGKDDLQKMDWAKYRQAFTMYDKSSAKSIGSYKLQIATVENGELKAVPRGVFTAAAALQGAREPILEFETGDVDGAKNHLKRYYDTMGRIAPWERQASKIDADVESVLSKASDKSKALALASMLDSFYEVKAGRTISASTMKKLNTARNAALSLVDVIGALIDDNTPNDDVAVNEDVPMETLQDSKQLEIERVKEKLKKYSARNRDMEAVQ